MVVRLPFGTRGCRIQKYGGGAGAQQSQNSLLSACAYPGLKVLVPSTAYYAKGIMIAAIREGGLVVVMEHKYLGSAAKGNVPEDPYTVPIGRAKIIHGGRHLTLCGVGRMTNVCLKVAKGLTADGIYADFIDFRR